MTLQANLMLFSYTDVKILVPPWFQPGTYLVKWQLWTAVCWCAYKSPRLRSRTSPQFVSLFSFELLHERGAKCLPSDLCQCWGAFVGGTIWSVFQTSVFVIRDSRWLTVSPEGERFQLQCRCSLVRFLFCLLFCVEGPLEICYQIIFKF